jgi:hypothetical protein
VHFVELKKLQSQLVVVLIVLEYILVQY